MGDVPGCSTSWGKTRSSGRRLCMGSFGRFSGLLAKTRGRGGSKRGLQCLWEPAAHPGDAEAGRRGALVLWLTSALKKSKGARVLLLSGAECGAGEAGDQLPECCGLSHLAAPASRWSGSSSCPCVRSWGGSASTGAEPYLWKARLLQPANAPGNTELERAERW